jgi:hypothetical protein
MKASICAAATLVLPILCQSDRGEDAGERPFRAAPAAPFTGDSDEPSDVDSGDSDVDSGDSDADSGDSEADSGEPFCPPVEENNLCDNVVCKGKKVCHEGHCKPLHKSIKPVPPTCQTFMWQNLQTDFIDKKGVRCTGRVTAAMGTRAVCYVASDNELKCAGSLFETTWGPNFTGTGVFNADQVMFGESNMCVLADGRILCMGSNGTGMIGTGDTQDVPVLTQWGAVNNIVRMGTGNMEQLCALRLNGDIYCSGGQFGLVPALQASGATRFWIDGFGDLRVDDAAVWRASQGRTKCTVGASGLACDDGTFGAKGQVVDGGYFEGEIDGDDLETHCWLSASGTVECEHVPTLFAASRVLALLTTRNSLSLCAVYDDASLWCIGPNEHGKLGTGDLDPLEVATRVQPSGRVRIDCK